MKPNKKESMHHPINKKGFTLMEMIVVIGALVIISVLVLVAVHNSRINARNTRRIADVNQLIKIVELHANANGGLYYDTGETYSKESLKCIGINSAVSCFGGLHQGDDFFSNEISKYMSIPKDPQRRNNVFDRYLYSSACKEGHHTDEDEPCIYWQPDGPINAVSCLPGNVGGSDADVCGYSCQFCTLGVSNKK